MKKNLKPAYQPEIDYSRVFIIDFYKEDGSPDGVLVGHSEAVFTSYREAYRQLSWFKTLSVTPGIDFRIRPIKLV